MNTRVVGWLSAVVVLAAVPRVAGADAWAGQKGELGLVFGQSFQFSDGIYYGDRGRITGLPVQSMRSVFGVEFTPVAKLTIGADLTGQFDRYSGPAAVMGGGGGFMLAHGPHDDGDWHGSITDTDLEVRYQVLDGAVALSPALKAKIPVTDYTVQGYASAGTGLWEVGAGLSLGKIGLGTDNLFGEVSYTFMFVQKEDNGGEVTEDLSTHYSLANLGLGYFVGERLSFQAGGEFRYAHGGLELDEIDAMTDPELIEWHDSILARRYLAITAGAGYAATESISIGATFAIVVYGDNVSDAKVFGLNVSWAGVVL